MRAKKRRTTTKTDSLALAKDFAEDWYFTLRGKKHSGQLISEKTFSNASEKFMQEYEVLTEGERNKRWVQDHYRRIRMYLNPFFGNTGLSRINAEWFHSIKQAQVAINVWLKEYNHIRPHHALRMCPPVSETLLEKSKNSGSEIGG